MNSWLNNTIEPEHQENGVGKMDIIFIVMILFFFLILSMMFYPLWKLLYLKVQYKVKMKKLKELDMKIDKNMKMSEDKILEEENIDRIIGFVDHLVENKFYGNKVSYLVNRIKETKNLDKDSKEFYYLSFLEAKALYNNPYLDQNKTEDLKRSKCILDGLRDNPFLKGSKHHQIRFRTVYDHIVWDLEHGVE